MRHIAQVGNFTIETNGSGEVFLTVGKTSLRITDVRETIRVSESEPMTTYSVSDIRAARDAANPNRPGCRRARAIQRRTGTHAHPWWKDPHPGQPRGCSLHPSAVALYRARQMAAIARLVRAGLY
jgi:hypothetical protein